VICTREQQISFWVENPMTQCRDLLSDWSRGIPSFPDVGELSRAEKDLLRPAIAANPSILQFQIAVFAEWVDRPGQPQ
jgi:hypothetical protein